MDKDQFIIKGNELISIHGDEDHLYLGYKDGLIRILKRSTMELEVELQCPNSVHMIFSNQYTIFATYNFGQHGRRSSYQWIRVWDKQYQHLRDFRSSGQMTVIDSQENALITYNNSHKLIRNEFINSEFTSRYYAGVMSNSRPSSIEQDKIYFSNRTSKKISMIHPFFLEHKYTMDNYYANNALYSTENYVVVGTNTGHIYLYDARSVDLISTVELEGKISAVYLTDTFLLVSSISEIPALFKISLQTMQTVSRFDLEYPVFSLNVDENVVLAGDTVGKIMVFNHKLVLERQTKVHSKAILGLDLDNNLIYSAGADGFIKVLSLQLATQKQVKAHDFEVMSVISDKNYLYSSSSDKTVKIWHRNSLEHVRTLNHNNWVVDLQQDYSNIYTASLDGHIQVYAKSEIAKKDQVLAGIHYEHPVIALGVNVNHIFSVTDDGKFRVDDRLSLNFDELPIRFVKKIKHIYSTLDYLVIHLDYSFGKSDTDISMLDHNNSSRIFVMDKNSYDSVYSVEDTDEEDYSIYVDPNSNRIALLLQKELQIYELQKDNYELRYVQRIKERWHIRTIVFDQDHIYLINHEGLDIIDTKEFGFQE